MANLNSVSIIFCFFFTIGLADAAVQTNLFIRALSGFRFNQGIVKTINDVTLQDCATRCFQNVSLVAFNFNNGSCELIVKQENTSSSSLTVNVNVNYYTLQSLNPCQSNPCLYGGQCVVTQDRMGYDCTNCPFPMGGKNCGDLNCNTFCFRVKDTVYFAYPGYSCVWLDAYRKCASDGMMMAMIKNNATHQVIRQKFLALYSNRTSAQEAFWIGMNRTSSYAKWKWVDGTTLAYNTGWAPGRPGNDICGCIPNGDPFYFTIDDDPCTLYPGWEYYPFCQKTFPFLLN